MQERSRLQDFPISFFAMVMGLSGLALAWEKAHHVFELSIQPHRYIIYFAAAVFITLLLIYITKIILHKQDVLDELKHPVKLNFFPAASISLLLLSAGFLHLSPMLSKYLWITGAVLHLGFTLYVMSIWIHHEHFEIHHMNPAWFIPVVGNVVVPVAGVEFGFLEVSWFFFSIGLLFWIVLFTIIFNRVLFHNPIPARLMPTFFILVAPPAVGFISYTKLSGGIDSFARILLYGGLFLTLLLLTQFRRFLKLQFFLSWWAYSFPMTAITIASMIMAAHTQTKMMFGLAVTLLSIATVLITTLLILTIRAILKKEICLPGH